MTHPITSKATPGKKWLQKFTRSYGSWKTPVCTDVQIRGTALPRRNALEKLGTENYGFPKNEASQSGHLQTCQGVCGQVPAGEPGGLNLVGGLNTACFPISSKSSTVLVCSWCSRSTVANTIHHGLNCTTEVDSNGAG